MILVDTSVWVDHLRNSEPELVQVLNDGLVLSHPFIVEELACGSLAKREEFIELLDSIPKATVADHSEVLDLITDKRLYSTGLGSVDVHIIASALLDDALIWSKDKVLSREAERLGISR